METGGGKRCSPQYVRAVLYAAWYRDERLDLDAYETLAAVRQAAEKAIYEQLLLVEGGPGTAKDTAKQAARLLAVDIRAYELEFMPYCGRPLPDYYGLEVDPDTWWAKRVPAVKRGDARTRCLKCGSPDVEGQLRPRMQVVCHFCGDVWDAEEQLGTPAPAPAPAPKERLTYGEALDILVKLAEQEFGCPKVVLLPPGNGGALDLTEALSLLAYARHAVAFLDDGTEVDGDQLLEALAVYVAEQAPHLRLAYARQLLTAATSWDE